MKKLNTKSLTRKLLERTGWTVDDGERWVRGANITYDTMGVGDLVAVCQAYEGATLFQATSDSNYATRRSKILAEPRAKIWLACGNRIELFGWKNEDEYRNEEITLEDFQ